MKQKKVIGLILSLVLVLCVAVPGTLASDLNTEPTTATEPVTTATEAPTETPTEPVAPSETPSEPVVHSEPETPSEPVTPSEPEEVFVHLDGCTEECTDEECACLCHVFQELMECQNYDEFMSLLNGISNEDYAKFTKKQVEQIEQKLLELKPTCTCIANEDGTHVEGCPLYVAPQAPTCTCGSEDGTHIEGCALYVAPEQPAEAEKTCTCDPAPAEGEAHKEGCPLYAAPEQPAEAEKTCTCDPKPAEGEAHLEGCPLYVKPTEENPFKELYDKLMATASIVEFTEIYAAYTDDDIAQFEKWVVENELLDSLKSHIYAISPAPTMPETVVFTNAGPFMPPVEVADSGIGN